MIPVLAVFSLADLNSPSNSGLIADKLDAYFVDGQKRGLDFKKILLPGESSLFAKSSYNFLNFPNVGIFWLFSFVSFGLFHLRLASIRTKVLKLKSKALGRSWEKVLLKTSPVVILGIGLPQELLEVANELAIPTIEVQHGSINRDSCLRYWPSFRPSLFFSWNDFTRNLATEFGVPAIAVGHPFTQNYRRAFIEPAKVGSAHSLESEFFCVALSWGVHGSTDPFGTLQPIVVQAIEEIVNCGLTPIFRIHPVTSRRFFGSKQLKKWLKARWPGSVIHDPRNTELLKSIVPSRFLLAFESSASLEFALCDKPSVLVDPDSAMLAKSALAEGVNSTTTIFSSFQGYRGFQGAELTAQRSLFRGTDELIKIVYKFTPKDQ